MFIEITLMVLIVIWLALTYYYALMLLNLFQQHEYNDFRFLMSMKTTPAIFFKWQEAVLIVWLIIQVFISKTKVWNIPQTANFALFILVLLMSYKLHNRQHRLFVKKLVYTARMKRLIVAFIFLTMIWVFFLVKVICSDFLFLSCANTYAIKFILGMLVLLQITPINISIANLFLQPLNIIINNF